MSKLAIKASSSIDLSDLLPRVSLAGWSAIDASDSGFVVGAKVAARERSSGGNATGTEFVFGATVADGVGISDGD